jgi:CO/xanthine dehydrogenase Mo-binding subunit
MEETPWSNSTLTESASRREIGTPWVAAAVANAFHKLTGKRLYHMPFTPERVQKALKA